MKTLNLKETLDVLCGTGYIRGKQWVKKVTRVDLEKSNGYAYEGEFLGYIKDQLQDIQINPGDVIIAYRDYGSTKNHWPTVAVAKIDNNLDFVSCLSVDGWDWAIKIREKVFELLQQEKPNPLAQFSIEELEKELERRSKK